MWCQACSTRICGAGVDRNDKGQFLGGVSKKVNQYGWELYFTPTEKECRKCKSIFPHSEFHKDATNKYGLAYWCKNCANSNSRKHHARRMKEDPTYQKQSSERHVAQTWGITKAEYDSRWKAQEYCLICGDKLRGGFQTHLDHNHKTGEKRGFLCTNCNRGLGHFQDNPSILEQAIIYLKAKSCWL